MTCYVPLQQNSQLVTMYAQLCAMKRQIHIRSQSTTNQFVLITALNMVLFKKIISAFKSAAIIISIKPHK
jgi:hypothetical protein